MKKLFFTISLGIISLSFANEKTNTLEFISAIGNENLIDAQTNSDPNLPVFTWKYLYKTTCGTYFYIELNKPFGELDTLEKENLQKQLEMKNNIDCHNKKTLKSYETSA